MNKQILRFLWLSGWIVLSFQTMNAQEKTNVWSLEACINHATNNNISVKSATYDVESAEISYAKLKAQKLPNLTAGVGQSVAFGSSIDPITGDFNSQTIFSSNISAGSQVTLYAGKQLNNQILQSQLQKEQYNYILEEIQNNIKLSVTEAYLQALIDKESVEIAENNALVSEKELERAKKSYEIGSVALREVTDVASQHASNQYAVLQAKNTYAQQILVLKQLLELDTETPFDIEIPNPDKYVSYLIPKASVLYNQAKETLPEIVSEKKNAEIIQKDIDLAKSGFFPTLSLSGSTSTGYTSSQESNFSKQLKGNYSTQFALSLNIPVFSKFENKYNVQKAKIEWEKSNLNIVSAEKTLYKELESLQQNAEASQQQITASKTARDAALQSFQLAQKQYELGALSSADLVITQNTYTNAELTYIQSKYQSVLYKLLLDYYQGNDLKL